MFYRNQRVYGMLKLNKGFTLVELMIALLLNAFLLAALTTIFLANLDHNRRMINNSRLNQQLNIAMNMMARDISRAGYWANATSDIGSASNNNPFMAANTDITVNAGGNCILFTYDHDANGALAAISSAIDDERYGFRLNNQTLQARPPGATFDCNAASSNWENVTDPGFISVTALSFTLNTSTVVTGPGTKGITFRSVTINLTGQLTSDSTVTKTITRTVKVRNDKLIS